MKVMNKLELINWVAETYGIDEDELSIWPRKDRSEEAMYVPIFDREYYRAIGRILYFWDDVGNNIGRFVGYVPLKGGTVVYRID